MKFTMAKFLWNEDLIHEGSPMLRYSTGDWTEHPTRMLYDSRFSWVTLNLRWRFRESVIENSHNLIDIQVVRNSPNFLLGFPPLKETIQDSNGCKSRIFLIVRSVLCRHLLRSLLWKSFCESFAIWAPSPGLPLNKSGDLLRSSFVHANSNWKRNKRQTNCEKEFHNIS